MTAPIILASGSDIRQDLLRNAGVSFDVIKARIDEDMIKRALIAEAASPRDIADALAEMKARKVAEKHPNAYVIGCDQVLDFGGTLFSKPKTPDDARTQLQTLRGQRHQLLSAAVIYHDGAPVWRHVGVVRMQMRVFSDTYLDGYLARNWDSIKSSVGAYKLEQEGSRLFARIDGDYFSVLGLPLIELMSYLTVRGVLQE